MGLVKKLVIGFFALALLGMIFGDGDKATGKMSVALGEAIRSGSATDKQWNEYNAVLDARAPFCVCFVAQQLSKDGAWNEDSVSADCSTSFSRENYVGDQNRVVNPVISGSVSVSGMNAFGATVKTNVSVSGFFDLTKDGGKYNAECSYFK
jgi:hypothetical protein